ncbi:hypothetical protein, partial [Escherichia coli]
IRYVVESRNRIQQQIATLTAQQEQWHTQGEQAQEDLAAAEEELAMAEERAAQAAEDVARKADELPAMEAQWRDAQTALNDQRAAILQSEQALKLEAAHQRNADQALLQLEQRRERLTQESSGLDKPDDVQLETLRAELAEQEEVLA